MVLIERSMPLYERMALFSISEVAVVTCTRDGMNLLPYEVRGTVVCGRGRRLALWRHTSAQIGVLWAPTHPKPP